MLDNAHIRYIVHSISSSDHNTLFDRLIRTGDLDTYSIGKQEMLLAYPKYCSKQSFRKKNLDI